jgi:hypothetical protein
MRFEDELKTYGCKMDINAFQDLVADLFHEMSRLSVDLFLCDPIEAIGFCYVVRYRTRCHVLPFQFILRILLDRRKSGDM